MANEKTPSTTPETSETAKVAPSANTENTSGNTYFAPIYGEKPDKESILKILKERSTAYEKCTTYEDATKILEKNNPDLFKRLQEKGTENRKSEETIGEDIEKKINDKNRVEDPKNQKKIDDYLAERGFAPDDKKKNNPDDLIKKKEIDKLKKNLDTEKKTGEGTIENTPENSRNKPQENSRTKPPENSRTHPDNSRNKKPDTKPNEEKEPAEKTEKIPEQKPEKKVSKPSNRNFNPFKALKHVGKKGLELLAMPLHGVSKAATSISRPQDIFKRQYRKDIGTNIGRGAKSMAKAFTGLVYAPHREDTQYVNTSQTYAKTQGPTGINKPEAAITSFGWTLGKLPKLASNIVAGTTNALAETLDSVRTGKADYSDTKLAFVRAGSRNPQGKSSK